MRDMIIKSQKCLVSDAECSHVNTCRYTLDRFGVFDCEPVEKKKVLEIALKSLKS